MSLRIAVALVATIGAGMLTATEAEARPDMVGFRGDYSPGTIVIRTNERRLYLVIGPGQAVRYPVGVGRPAGNGPAPPRSTVNTAIPRGRRRRS